MAIQKYTNKIISIIIIVKDDRGIYNTLKALETIEKPVKTETIVIDASSGKLNDIKKQFPRVSWYAFRSKKYKKVTIPEQRNDGIKKANGNIIVFIDANCVPMKKWLSELYRYHIKEKEFIVAGAALPFDKKVVNTISDERFKSKYLKEAPTINILYDRSVFEKIGYFDVSGTYGEDVNLAWRAIDAGYKIRYAKKKLSYIMIGEILQNKRRE